jgi:site-specific recombinase XerD
MTDTIIPNPAQIKERIMAIDNVRDKALISFLYLTGARISEVVKRFNVSNIQLQKKDSHIIYLFRLYTEKTRKQGSYRNVPISYENNKEYIEAIKDYINIARLGADSTMFSFSRTTAWNICQNWLGFNPHFLRHIRLTHLVQDFGFADQKLVSFTGWKDSRPASIYTHLNWKDLIT